MKKLGMGILWGWLGVSAVLLRSSASGAAPFAEKEPCRAAAYQGAEAFARLRMPGETFQMGGVSLLNRDARAASVLYEFDILDQDPRHPEVWPGHTIVRVKMDSRSCVPDSIQFVESFMGQ